MRLVSYLFINALAIFIASYILPGVDVDSWVTIFIVAIVLGAVNAVIKPILIFLTLPLTIITLGLFTFVINALLVMLTSYLVPGFTVANFWWALLFSLVISLISSFLSNLTKE